MRWEDPQRGLLTAGDFIGDMDAAGLILPLDEWVARALTEQRRAWHAAGLDPHVAFNLGPRSLTVQRVERILTCLADDELDPSRVTVEISEADALGDDGVRRAALHTLRAAGVSLAIDDFGVAYSSLSRLREVPAEWIKVDRSFLAGVPGNAGATRVLDAILALLAALGGRVIVEGVETIAQREHLLDRPCDALQGYLLGRPMPADRLEALLRSTPERPVGTAPAAAR